MTKEFINQTGHQRAYARWFSDYERERLRQKKRKGARLDDFPEPPASPEAITQALDRIGRRRFCGIVQAHRSTLARWESGASVMARSTWLLLVLLDEGRLPGMSTDWSGWRFDGDRLHLAGTRLSFSARELAGIPYQQQHAQALSRQVAALQKQNAQLLRLGVFDCANDPLICVS